MLEPPVVGNVSHHSVDLSWASEENQVRKGPSENRTLFSVEKEDSRTHKYNTIYMWVHAIALVAWERGEYVDLKKVKWSCQNVVRSHDFKLFTSLVWIPLICFFVVVIFRGYSTQYTVEGLEPRTSYNVRLKLTHPSGETTYSPVVMISTTSKCSTVWFKCC